MSVKVLTAFAAGLGVSLAGVMQADIAKATDPDLTIAQAVQVNPPTAGPKDCPPDVRSAPGRNEPAGNLSDELARSKGVICPPAGVDPGLAEPPPAGGRTPIIPPPGSPGGNPNIIPK
jgi:hypothetical protein